MFQDKKENGYHDNRNAYNTLKIDQIQRKKCKLYRIMFVCCKMSKKILFWKLERNNSNDSHYYQDFPECIALP